MLNQLLQTVRVAMITKPRHTASRTVRGRRSLARLAILGLFPVVFQLTGCTSAPPDETRYNPATGFPAVGDRPWNS